METKRLESMMSRAGALAASLILAAAIAGCEHDDSAADHTGGQAKAGTEAPVEKSALVGTWKLTDSSGSSWYIHFGDDGNWRITNDKAGNERRVYGTYKVNGDQFSGPMTNPGVGSGDISGTFAGNALNLNFTEYWHTPHKVVPYTGARQ